MNSDSSPSIPNWKRYVQKPLVVFDFLAEHIHLTAATFLFGPPISIFVVACTCFFGSLLLGLFDTTQDIGHWVFRYTGWITMTVFPTIWFLLLIAARRASETYYDQIFESHR